MKNVQEDTQMAVAEYTQALAELDTLGDAPCYIVRCGNTYLTFDVAPNQAAYEVFNVRACKPHQALRFTWRDAKTVSALVRGNGCSRGEVVHVRTAVEEVLDAYQAVLTTLEAFARGDDPTLS